MPRICTLCVVQIYRCRLAQRLTFKPRRNVNAVAEDVITVDDNIANINADAENDTGTTAGVGSTSVVASGHRRLDGHRAVYRVHGTGELHQHAVTRCLDDTPVVRGNRWINHLTSMSLQCPQRHDVVYAHQTAVAYDIRRKNSRQPSFHPLSGQKKPLKLQIQPGSSKHARLLWG